MAGAAIYVNWSAEEVALVPPAVVTVMSAVPEPAGEVAVICVALSSVNEVAPVAPNFTDVAPVKSVPVIVTLVPPDAGPDAGEILLTAGAGLAVFVSNRLAEIRPVVAVTE